jgi:hypothetical protein
MPPARPHPPAAPHGAIEEVLPGFYFVTGTVSMPGPIPVRFSRNMTIVREGDRLVIVNSVRLDDAGLAALDKLGTVTDVIRLAANHGMDDPFYAARYGAKVWAVKGQRYTPGFDTSKTETYFTGFETLDEGAKLPIDGASLYFIHSTPPEGLLVVPRHGGVIISGDCLQNWANTDAYFNWLGSGMMKMMGFVKPHNVGPGWLSQCKPPKQELRAILDLPFANVLPAHGVPAIGGAVDLYRPAIERAAGS